MDDQKDSKDSSVASGDKGNEEEEDEDVMILKECPHCANHPCVVREVEPLLVSILEIYGGYRSAKSVRHKMYTDVITHIHGPCLGKGVRRKPPSCVVKVIREMSPDPDGNYKGFVEHGNAKS